MGFVLAFVVGVVLGLLGGGGSILTVPILVYVMDINPVLATGYSLFIVGVSALIGTQRFIVAKQVDFKIGTIFAIPSFLGVFICRKWILPTIPDLVFQFGSFELSKEKFLLLFFAVIMLIAGLSMVFSRRKDNSEGLKKLIFPLIALEGFIVGALTGLVGAGGGFLIIPALVILTGLDIKKAIGTSLMIIAFKSLFGFLGELGNEIDWSLLLIFTFISCIGIFVGTYTSKFINGNSLKRYFGIFVLLFSIFIFVKELLL
jgi:uncharacterized membrane protein YfcA